MSDIMSELDNIKLQISNKNFLANKGLSNELGIHVFCYDPQNELIVRDFIERMTSETSDLFNVIERDLYKIFISILEEKKVVEAVIALEEKRGRDYMLTQVQNITSPDMFLSKMRYAPHNPGKDVLFLTGVGKVYPFMRSHIMLNAMQKEFSDIPIIMFYPGTFSENSLSLFNKFFDGNYYRAFNQFKLED